MMGQQSLTESLFYYFRLEDQIPADHLLRLINGYVDFSAHVGPWNQRTAFDVRSGLLYCWAIRRWHIEVYRQAVILWPVPGKSCRTSAEGGRPDRFCLMCKKSFRLCDSYSVRRGRVKA
jgi:hypothetical protein